MLLSADGKTRSLPVIKDKKGLGASALSAVLPWKEQLLVVGELGVNLVQLPRE